MSKKFAVLILASAALTAIPSAIALGKPVDDLTLQSVQFAEHDDLGQAMEVASRAASSFPKSWLAHANLSYIAWKQGDVVQAFDEGRKAIDLSPRNRVALLNLANIQEAMGSCSDALMLYKAALKLNADDLDAALGCTRCEIRSGKTDEGLGRLRELRARSGKTFDWYLKVADTYLQAGEADAAIGAVDQARKLVIGNKQKSRADLVLFTALLRDKNLKRAADLKDTVWHENEPKTEELFVLSSQLVSTPAQALSLVELASIDLTEHSDSDAFFRLSRIFAERAATAPDVVRDHWLAVAAKSAHHAVELAPEQGRYHLALAGLLSSLGQKDHMQSELAKAHQADPYDAFVDFLSAGQNVSFSEVHFKVNGLNSGCHVSRVASTLRNSPGVAFVGAFSDKEYELSLLLDPATTKADDVFAECRRKAFDTLPVTKEPRPEVSFEILSSRSLETTADAISTVQDQLYRSPLKFNHYFNDVVPTAPTKLVAIQNHRKPS